MQRTKPPFRADHVGSLLRSSALKEARARRQRGEATTAELKAVEDREIEALIRRQEEVGLRSVTDGEYRRSWWHLDSLWGPDGFERHVMDQGIAFAGVQTRAEGARIVGKVGFSRHPMIEHFRFLQAKTKRTPKMTIPAPSAAYGRVGRTAVSEVAYPKLDEFFADLGAAIAKPCAPSRMRAAATCSSMRSTSPCCATRSFATPSRSAATTRTSSARLLRRSSMRPCPTSRRT